MASERNANQVPSLLLKSNAADNADVIGWADPTTHRLLVDALVSALQLSGNGTISDGAKNVTTAGTRLAIASSTACRKVTVQAKPTNTGNIYVGGATVSSTSGIALTPYNSIVLNPSNLNLVFIDSDVNGEGVTFTYEN